MDLYFADWAFKMFMLPVILTGAAMPFLFHWAMDRGNGSSVRWGVTILVTLSLLVLGAFLMLSYWGSRFGGRSYGYPEDQLSQPFVIFMILVVLVGAFIVAMLAATPIGTLGMWAFALAVSVLAYWAGLGLLPPQGGSSLVAAGIAAMAGGLVGMLSTGERTPSKRTRVAALWTAICAVCAGGGLALASEALNSATQRNPQAASANPDVLLVLLVVALLVWLATSGLAALVTGYASSPLKPSHPRSA